MDCKHQRRYRAVQKILDEMDGGTLFSVKWMTGQITDPRGPTKRECIWYLTISDCVEYLGQCIEGSKEFYWRKLPCKRD